MSSSRNDDREARFLRLAVEYPGKWATHPLDHVGRSQLHFRRAPKLIRAVDREEIFDDFLRIGSSSPAEQVSRVIDFAKRYGAIGLCTHGWPASHGAIDFAVGGNTRLCYERSSEPIQRWVDIATTFHALLEINDILSNRQRVPDALWIRAGIDREPVEIDFSVIGGKKRRMKPTPPASDLSFAITQWVTACSIRPTVVYDDSVGEFDIEMTTALPRSSGEWFANVVWELAIAISGASEYAVCKNPNCREMFKVGERKRKYCTRRCAELGSRLVWWRKHGEAARRDRRQPVN